MKEPKNINITITSLCPGIVFLEHYTEAEKENLKKKVKEAIQKALK